MACDPSRASLPETVKSQHLTKEAPDESISGSLARSFSVELLDKGIRVNALSPGPINTPIIDRMGLTLEQKAGFMSQITSPKPMKRVGTSEEVAQAALYLAVEATYSSGIELNVDGGAGQL